MYETVTNNTGNGWGPLWGAVIGGIGGYLVGKKQRFRKWIWKLWQCDARRRLSDLFPARRIYW